MSASSTSRSSSRKTRTTVPLPNLGASSSKKKKEKNKKKKKKKLLIEDPRVVRDLIHFAETNQLSGLKQIIEGIEYEKKFDFQQGAGEAVIKAAEKGHNESLIALCDAGAELLKKERIAAKRKHRGGGSKKKKKNDESPLTIANLQNGKPLQKAAASGQLGSCQLLVLTYFADCNSKSLFFEFSPLHFGAKYGHFEVVKFLVGQGAKLDAITHNENCGATCGWTPLHFAADGGYVSIVRYLIESGASIDYKTISNDTALSIAAESGKWDVVRYLVSIGSDIHSTRRGLSVVNWAIYRADPSAVQYLVSYGAKPDLSVRTLWLPNGRSLGEICDEQFSEAISEQIDLAIYRGGKQVKERELKRKLIAEIQWEDKAVYDPYSFDSLPASTIKRFNDSIVNLIVAYEM